MWILGVFNVGLSIASGLGGAFRPPLAGHLAVVVVVLLQGHSWGVAGLRKHGPAPLVPRPGIEGVKRIQVVCVCEELPVVWTTHQNFAHLSPFGLGPLGVAVGPAPVVDHGRLIQGGFGQTGPARVGNPS